MSAVPVIVGIGEIVDRPDDPAQTLEPLASMAEVLQRADRDAGGGFLARLDSLDIVQQTTWRYQRTAAQLCERARLAPARAVYGITGGESPVRYLHEAALRIARRESQVAAICGAEAQYAVARAKSAGVDLPWTTPAAELENRHVRESILQPAAIRHSMMLPVQIYPLYENATLAAWGQTPQDAHAESAALWSRFAAVAARNSYSWIPRALTPSDIAVPAPDNRLIAHPYTKRMVANPLVNQGAAVILTSLEQARAAGVPEDRLVFVWGGAAASEPRDYLAREQYVRSDAQDVVFESVQRLCDESGVGPDACELYSCFPVVPKMARRVLEYASGIEPTVTGGLSFFGAPLNNYMTHAICAMTRRLRSGDATTGLLYGQGEYVTKHHALVLARTPPRRTLASDYSVQHLADSRRGPVPPFREDYEGSADIETHTVIYGRDGEPLFGTVIARADGARIMARIAPDDADGIRCLTNADRSPVGMRGRVGRASDGMLRFSV
jgi:acetyl-CoA acetyltransferase